LLGFAARAALPVPKVVVRTFAGDAAAVRNFLVGYVAPQLKVALPKPPVASQVYQAVYDNLPGWKVCACAVGVGLGLMALGEYGAWQRENATEALVKASEWLDSRNQDDRVTEIRQAHPSAWTDETLAVAASKEVTVAVNLAVFGKERTREGLAELYKVLGAEWKEKQYTAEVQFALKQMATAVYWCVPDSEIRLLRFGTTGAVRQSVDRYRLLRDSAPRVQA
jgi:hypothetical protein